MPFPRVSPPALRRLCSSDGLRAVCLVAPVAAGAVTAVILALRALPVTGTARLVLAAAVGINVLLLGLSSWSSILNLASGLRNRSKIRRRSAPQPGFPAS